MFLQGCQKRLRDRCFYKVARNAYEIDVPCRVARNAYEIDVFCKVARNAYEIDVSAGLPKIPTR